MKARQDAVVDTTKDDDEEVQRKREEREAAKRKDEKVCIRSSVPLEILPVANETQCKSLILTSLMRMSAISAGTTAAELHEVTMLDFGGCLQTWVMSQHVSLYSTCKILWKLLPGSSKFLCMSLLERKPDLEIPRAYIRG